jgi:UDP-glucose 4-epimerase
MKDRPHSVVLGAGGYIGSHLCIALREAGHTVTGYDIPSVAGRSPDLISWDMADGAAVPEDFGKADYLFLFAGLSGTTDSFLRWEEYMRVNVVALARLLHHVAGLASPPKVVFPSSRLVYAGQKGKRIPEEAPKEARTVYASNKLAGEQLVQLYARKGGFSYTVFRICVPYGNMCSDALSYGTLRHFLERAVAGQPICVYGDGSQRRSLIFVGDLCRLIISAVQLPQADNQIFNLGGPDDLSIGEIAEAIGKKYGVPVEYIPWPEDALKLESGDTVFDESRLSRILPLDYQLRFSDWLERLTS